MENSVEKNTFAILFFIKKKKLLKNGQVRIFMRITVKGEKVEISTDQCVDPDHWDTIRHRLKPSVLEAAYRNNYLRNLELKVQEHKRRCEELSGKDFAPGRSSGKKPVVSS